MPRRKRTETQDTLADDYQLAVTYNRLERSLAVCACEENEHRFRPLLKRARKDAAKLTAWPARVDVMFAAVERAYGAEGVKRITSRPIHEPSDPARRDAFVRAIAGQR